jgi:hypothetical protein
MAGSIYNSLFGSNGNAQGGQTFGSFTITDGSTTNMGITNGEKFGGNSNQKLGLWGATPVIQPAGKGELLGLNGNAATAANATNMNSNGNVGNSQYGLNDLVKALKQAGVLAQ